MAKNVAELESEACKFFRSPHRITMDEHLTWFRNHYLSNDKRRDWMCFEKSSSSKIGVLGSVIDGENSEINFILAPSAKGMGYALEAVHRIIRYVRSEFHVKRFPALRF